MNFDFSKLGNIADMMKEFKNIQEKMQRIQEKLATVEFEVSSGAGMVKVFANAKSEILSIKVDDTLRQEPDFNLIQDLIAAAVNEAHRRAKEIAEEEMMQGTGFDLSMLKNMFNV
ncbi:MAG: YbaB/EbfC family nucleoid-associated protein [Pseudomonadota bacterium]